MFANTSEEDLDTYRRSNKLSENQVIDLVA